MDYRKLGLRCGIEIHQQLDTRKLFCSCPSTIRDDAPHFTVRRELRASAGETDEVDVAALHEIKKEKYFIYGGYDDTTCLVELDDEPPHSMNSDALSAVLSVSRMLDARIVDEIEVMRKIVVNGSNTSGFQRTALVAMDGKIAVGGKKIGIPTISIEEEAAKQIESKDEFVRYGLDRLGIPLIEIGTDPDIETPTEAKDVAEKIGMVLRSTGKVKRGLGTIRQDVNVSIKDGARIEIKGAQELKLIPLLVENEAKRQMNLLAIRDELRKRGAKENDGKIIEVTGALKDTGVAFVKKAIDSGKKAFAMRLEKFGGLIGKEDVRNQRLGFEFGAFAKLLGLGGVIHSDENLEKYGFLEDEIKKIKKDLSAKEEDAFVICTGDERKVRTLFVHYIQKRANDAMRGVPKEVRSANPDGTTTYMRPMPGGARMYPETDVPPIKPDVGSIEVHELIEEKLERIKGHRISNDLASLIAKAGRADEFEGYVKSFGNLKAAFIGEMMIPKMLELRRNGVPTEKITKDALSEAFAALDSGKIAKASFEILLTEAAKGKSIDAAIKENELEILSDANLEREVRRILDANKSLEEKHIIGKLMAELRGKAEAEKIIGMLKRMKR